MLDLEICYFTDWSHEDAKRAVRHKGEFVDFTKDKFLKLKDVQVVAENLPNDFKDQLIKNGCTVYRMDGKMVHDQREALGIPKTDENDCHTLEVISIDRPELLRESKLTPIITKRYSQFKMIQEVRKKVGNQMWAYPNDQFGIEILEELNKLEKDIVKQVGKELKDYPIWTEFMQHVKGVGPAVAGCIVGNIDKLGIENFPYPSKLRKECGVFVHKGRAARFLKAEGVRYNSTLKTVLLGILAASFMKSNSPYRAIYDNEKEKLLNKVFPVGYLKAKGNGYKETDTMLKRSHADQRARRKMVSVFLNHLWVIWRQLEGLPTPMDYQFDKLGHTNYIEPLYVPERLRPFNPTRFNTVLNPQG